MSIYDSTRGFTFDYVGFDRATWSETGPIVGVAPGGKISRVMTDLKESGSLQLSDINAIADDSMVRIYANDSYTGTRKAVATMRMTRPSSTVDGTQGEAGDVKLLSVLSFAQRDCPIGAFVVAVGDNLVERAAEIFTGLGLKVSATPSARLAHDAKIYCGTDWDWLSIANDILTGSPNYSSAWTDHMGTVMLTPYTEPKDQQPKASFTDGANMSLPNHYRFVGKLSNEDDWYTVPNRLKLIYEADDRTYTAVATDATGTRLSYDRRGYWVTEQVSVSSVDGDTVSDIQAYLDTLAPQKLRAAQSNVASTEFSGEYVDELSIGDVVGLDWEHVDRSYIRSLYSYDVRLTASMQASYKIREFIRGDGVS